MTMFTEGRLQAYERMMQQTNMSHSRERDSKPHGMSRGQNKSSGKQVVKGGVRRGSYQS